MKVLFVASEAYPFVKTGGLGDVAYALPKALREMGVDIRVIIPKYSEISHNFKSKMSSIKSFEVPVGWRKKYCGLQSLKYDGIPYYFLDNEYYFKRPYTYGYFDDGERYSFFCRAVLESIKYMDDFTPDIIHCNDWHSGMIPVLMKHHLSNEKLFKDIKSIFTIHNLRYQGIFPKVTLTDLLDLNDSYFSEDKLKYYDSISFMKGGINFSDKVTTVSETYAEEIKTPPFGEGLHGLFHQLDNNLKGIVNGIDYDIFNPKTDVEIYENYSIDTIEKKTINKLGLQNELNLPVNKDIPLIGIVSRLVNQKGFDLIANIIEDLLRMDLQLVVLGTGQDDYQDLFQYYSCMYPSKLSSNIKFSSTLAKKIYASSDMFLMPSLFEPCGIGQLIALRYGTIPIVRETGGLKDTVTPFNEYSNLGTGFSFTNYNADEMLKIIKYALKIYKDKEKWNIIMKSAMSQNNSWSNSAKLYKDIYTNA